MKGTIAQFQSTLAAGLEWQIFCRIHGRRRYVGIVQARSRSAAETIARRRLTENNRLELSVELAQR